MNQQQGYSPKDLNFGETGRNKLKSGITKISEAINAKGGTSAVAQQLSEQYIAAFDKLAREGTIALLPTDGSDIASVVSKGYTAFDLLKKQVEGSKKS